MAFKKKTVEEKPVAQPVITDDDLLNPDPVHDVLADTPAAPVKSTPAPVGVMMTPEDIARIAAEAAKAATVAVSQAGGESVADIVAKALTGYMGPRQKTIAELGEPKTPFNPTGQKRQLKKDFFHNNAPLNERFLHDREIELLHQLVPGHYGTEDFPIAVIERKRKDGKSRVTIVHNDGKNDRNSFKNYAAKYGSADFTGCLLGLIAEAKEQKAARRAEARRLLEDSDD